MSWCVECGAVGRPELATVTVDGDPLCNGCARARGSDAKPFNAAFVDSGMDDFKKSLPVEAPSAPEEKKQMATCACGCGGQLKPGTPWVYLRGHKTAKQQGNDVPTPKKSKRAAELIDENRAALQADVDPSLLDALWNALPEAQKKNALRAAIDSIL